MNEIQRRLERINELQAIIQKATEELSSILGLGPETLEKPRRERARYEKTCAVMVKEALQAQGQPQDREQIRKTIRQLHGVLVKRGSISSSLSHLKKNGEAAPVSPGMWALAENR